jgi:hypothetical protein
MQYRNESILLTINFMKTRINALISLILVFFISINIESYSQVQTSGTSTATQYKMTTAVPPGIVSPDKVETRLGTLNFFDGFPDNASVEKLFDNLDFQRAVQAYLLAIPPVSMVALREGLKKFGPENTTIPTFENLMDSRSLFLTANANTPYTWMWINLKDGPLVAEIPSNVLGMINDFWFYFVTDIGIVGPDKGKGGKYLVLPPNYQGDIPGGYYVIKMTTYEGFLGWRNFAVNGDFKPSIENIKKTARVYPLSQAANPPANKFVNVSSEPFSTLAPADYKFWEYLNDVIQSSPVESLDPISLGFYASIGIEKGKSFTPDARMKKILTEAAAVGDATARALTFRMRQKENYYYENSAWCIPFTGGYKFEFQPDVRNLDAFSSFYFYATGVTPAMEAKMVGQGSQYAAAFVDSKSNPLDGGKNYRLHLPPNIPINNFWSVIVYDNQTRSMIQTDQQFPMVTSQNTNLQVNSDGSVDVFFGPTAPAGKENNWVQTIPGKGWNTLLRIYGPLQPWFDKTWRPGEIEEVK